MFNTKLIKKKFYYKIGYFAEILVIIILMFKFHRIVRHRYISHLGEIDIITIKGNAIFFIEVKARSNYDALSESITTKKRKKIFRIANNFMAKYPKALNYEQHFLGYLISWRGIKVVKLY